MVQGSLLGKKGKKTGKGGGRRLPEKGGDRAALKENLGAELGVAPEKDIQETLGLGRGGEGNVPEERR